MDCGAYCLLIRFRRRQRLRVGRLGVFDFPAGFYVYCGSALGGLAARLRRHVRKAKRLHWHIDYLLASPAARIVETRTYPSERRLECVLARAVLATPGARVAAPGFGSSDCRAGCPAHLIYFPRRPALPARDGLKGLPDGPAD